MLYRVDVSVTGDPRTWIVDSWFPTHTDAVHHAQKWTTPNVKYRVVPVAAEVQPPTDTLQ